MKRLVLYVLGIVGALMLAGFVGDRKAERMIEDATDLAGQGQFEAALKKLDAIESWLSWTDPASRLEQVRAEIENLARTQDGEAVLDARLSESERVDRMMDAAREAYQRAPADPGAEFLQRQQERANAGGGATEYMRRMEEDRRRLEEVQRDVQRPEIRPPTRQ